MQGPVKGWSPERGKGPAAPGGQAGRARARGGPALQAWARGDSYSDTGSAVATATGSSASARPARDPRPAPRPPPLRPRASHPPPPPAPPVFVSRKRRLAARPLPSPGGSAGRTEATPRLSQTPARPGPHVHGRRRSAELSRIAPGTRSQNTRSTTRSPSLFHAHARVPPRPPVPCPVRTTPAAPVSTALSRPGPWPPPPRQV